LSPTDGLFNNGTKRSVIVAEDLLVLDKIVGLDPTSEFIAAKEDVITTIDLTRTHRTGSGGHAERQERKRREQMSCNRGLSRTAGGAEYD
jgi:hypothetical protein